MISQLLNRAEKTYKQFQNVKEFITSVIDGDFNMPKKDLNQEMAKRFQQNSKESPPSSDFINSKIESMTHSQGMGNFSGSGYQSAGSASHDKIIHNKPRHH